MKDFFGIGWGIVSAILMFIGGNSYMYRIIKGDIKRPVLSTWTLWFVIGLILFLANLGGAKINNTFLPLVFGIVTPFIVLVLSIIYGRYEWGKLDAICIVLFFIAIVIWQIGFSTIFGVIGAIVTGVVASIPQIKKSWTDPKDELIFPWLLFSIGMSLYVLAFENMSVQNIAYPACMTIVLFIITAPIVAFRIMES